MKNITPDQDGTIVTFLFVFTDADTDFKDADTDTRATFRKFKISDGVHGWVLVLAASGLFCGLCVVLSLLYVYRSRDKKKGIVC